MQYATAPDRHLCSSVLPELNPDWSDLYRPWPNSLCPTKVVILEGQRTNSLAGYSEDGVANRWGNPSNRFLSHARNRVVGGSDKMDLYLGNFSRSQQRVGIKVSLYHATLLDRDFLAQYCSQPHRYLHFDLPLRREWVHEERTGVHGNVKPFRPYLAFLADRDSGHNGANSDLGPAEATAVPDGDSHTGSRWQLLAPGGLLCDCAQYVDPAFRKRKLHIRLE